MHISPELSAETVTSSGVGQNEHPQSAYRDGRRGALVPARRNRRDRRIHDGLTDVFKNGGCPQLNEGTLFLSGLHGM